MLIRISLVPIDRSRPQNDSSKKGDLLVHITAKLLAVHIVPFEKWENGPLSEHVAWQAFKKHAV